MRFSDLDLHKEAIAGTVAAGFSECMPVQSAVLPVSLSGKDVMVQSKTGSGKTAAFILTFLEKFLRNREQGITSKCLIIVPTRELAQQIASDAEILCGKTENFTVGCFFGGVGYEPQVKLLRNGCDIYVGTPGRLLDFIRSKQLDCHNIDTFVMDEADRMFDMGFMPDIQKIFSYLPAVSKRQTMLFSATLEMRIRELAWEYMKDPVEIELEPEHITVENITQELFHVAKAEKFKLFLQIMAKENPESALVFTNSRYMTETVCKRLKKNGYNADFISGDLSQTARNKALKNIKTGKTKILVATDVAARGLQIDDLPLVVNYDVPEDYENYVHRIGRTARAGKSGKAITLADEEFVYGLEAIEKYIGYKIPVIWPDDYPEVYDKSERSEQRKKEKSVKVKTEPKKNFNNHLGKMTEAERLEYYKKKYGFVPVKKPEQTDKKKAEDNPSAYSKKTTGSGKFYKVLWLSIVALPAILGLAFYFLVGLIPTFVLRIFSKKFSDGYLFFHCRLISRYLLFLFGVKAEISGHLENINIENKPVCYISNHTSLLDIVLLAGPCKIKTGFIAKKEIIFVPFINLAVIAMHGVFMDRKNLKNSIKSIKRGAEKIRNGNAVLIFPEGTRSKNGKIAPFKRGALRLATEAKALIVPISIRGVREALEDRSGMFFKTKCYVYVGEITDSSAIKDREELNLLNDRLEKEIINDYNRLKKKTDSGSF